jgi:hypothetical protein
MSSSRAYARKHLTKAEFELYTSTLEDKVGALSAFRLKQKADRLKKMRAKLATQKRGQKRTLKQKGFDNSADTNRKIKLDLVSEMLGRVEQALKKAPAAAKKVVKKTVKKSTKKVAKKATKKVAKKTTKKAAKKATKKAAKKTTKKAVSLKAKQAPKGVIKRKKLNRSGVLRKQGHASARTKRSQGKRDRR